MVSLLIAFLKLVLKLDHLPAGCMSNFYEQVLRLCRWLLPKRFGVRYKLAQQHFQQT